ncbi:PD-(D/E)XK nuclease superfamily protein [uncultured archaeon]|nr:PD-(D/E)XK nuclease superfamily protein [uncultured archaeon]
MATYSHSKISTYENCPYQYKLHYIDKVEVETPTTIEPFMGDMVHQSLEDLYKRKKFKQRISKETLIKFYRDLWDKSYSEDIRIVKDGLDAKNYKKMGEKFLSDYYDRMKPFEQMTILGLETQDRMTLPDGNQWHVRIDKLGCDDKGNYYVCDYKTNSRMKDQEEADSDRQLAMYSIWVKDKFKDAKSVKLIWHMLAFNKDAVSERTEKQLKELQEQIVNLIKEIEKATKENNFPRKQSALCDYCVYKEQCPSFKHEIELEKIESVEKFKQNEGVIFVDEFSEIKKKLAELKEKEDEFKEKLIQYAKQFGIDIIYGSNKKCSVKEFEKIILPEDEKEKIKFVQLLKDKGLWEEFSMICYPKLNSKAIKGEIDKDLKKMIDIEKDFRLSLSQRKDIEDE